MIGILEKIYSKLPDFGPELKDLVVRLLPPLVLIVGILITLMSILEILGTPFISVVTLGTGGGPLIQTLIILNVLGVIQGILMILAFAGLRKRRLIGWKLTFWSQIIWIITGAISFSLSLFLAIIFLYPLFEVKKEYKQL